MNNNGKEEIKQPEKTLEQLASERLGRYQKDPETFIELSDVICIAIKSPASSIGVAVLVGNVTRPLLDIGIAELNHHVNKVRMQMDIRSEIIRQATKIQPTHNIIDGVRKMFRRK